MLILIEQIILIKIIKLPKIRLSTLNVLFDKKKYLPKKGFAEKDIRQNRHSPKKTFDQ